MPIARGPQPRLARQKEHDQAVCRTSVAIAISYAPDLDSRKITLGALHADRLDTPALGLTRREIVAVGGMRRPLILAEACTLGGGTRGPSSRPPNPPPPSLLSVPLRKSGLSRLGR